jgi:transcriptional regulator with XRE-family HTH domain
MHSSRWDRGTFRQALTQIMTRANLSQQDVADIAGMSRPQVSRWAAGAHRPNFDPVTRLAAWVRRNHPDLTGLADDLVAAAGYGQPAGSGSEDRPRFPGDPELDEKAEKIWALRFDDKGRIMTDDAARVVIAGIAAMEARQTETRRQAG